MPQRYLQPSPSKDSLRQLRDRVGSLHLNQRLGLERDHALDTFGHGSWFHPENWLSGQRMGRNVLRLLGVEAAGRRLARKMRPSLHEVFIDGLPTACHGMKILHLSDLHLDMAEDTTDALLKGLDGIDADLCVLTGDYRAKTYGPIDRVIVAFNRLKASLDMPCFAVLGNHDCLAMVEAMEAAGIQVLLNESVSLCDGRLYLSGIDDPHFYRVDSVERAMAGLPEEGVASILLSHSPEIYREVAYSGVDLLLCGHTHGGQVCLPGGYALTYDCRCPRRFCRGAWRHRRLQGYTSRGCGTSVLDIRFFCPPEIVVHRLLPAVS